MTFHKNHFTGSGTIDFPDGTRYTGQIKDALRHGQGSYENAEFSYKGEWKEGKKSGFGLLKTKSGKFSNIHKNLIFFPLNFESYLKKFSINLKDKRMKDISRMI